MRILEHYHLHGMTKSEISRQLLTPYSTIWRIIRRFTEDSEMTSRLFTPKPINLLNWNRAQKVLFEYIKFNAYPFNSTEIQRFLMKTTGIECTKFSILRNLKEFLNYSYKRVSSRLVRKPASLTKLKKIIFWVEYVSMINNRIVLVNIDETLFSNSTKWNYSWAKRGQPTFRENIWFTGSVSIIVSITSKGNVHYSSLQEDNNSDNLIDYLKNLMKLIDADLKLWRKKVILLMDNSPMHTSKIWRDFLNSLGWVFLFLPPYSPE